MMRAMLAESPLAIIGHRGAAALAPENTLASFREAVRRGVDAVELDVQRCGDELAVIHDDRVDRTTNGAGAVADLSFEALRRLDAGDGERIPTLEEVLDAVPPSVAVNVELKGPDTAAPAAERLAGLDRPLLVSSFDWAELRRFHQRCPGIACAPLCGRWRRGLAEVAGELGAWSVNLADRLATADRLAAIRTWGCRCLVYTVNDVARTRELAALGVAGIFTDDPSRFARGQRPRADRIPGPGRAARR